MQLPDDERAELVAILADSLRDEHTEREVESAWMSEAKHRLERIRNGTSTSVPWQEVNRKLRAMLDGARLRRTTMG
jgi:putative addiction module component (TIGR02574 family)